MILTQEVINKLTNLYIAKYRFKNKLKSRKIGNQRIRTLIEDLIEEAI